MIFYNNQATKLSFFVKKDEQWVIKKLKSKNINNIKDVIFAGIQADKKMYVVTYDDSTEIDL